MEHPISRLSCPIFIALKNLLIDSLIERKKRDMTNTTQGVHLHGVYGYSCQTARRPAFRPRNWSLLLLPIYPWHHFWPKSTCGTTWQFDWKKMEEWGKRKIVLRRAPPAFAPPPPSNPTPFPPPAGLKDQKRRGQAGFIARLRRAIYRFTTLRGTFNIVILALSRAVRMCRQGPCGKLAN